MIGGESSRIVAERPPAIAATPAASTATAPASGRARPASASQTPARPHALPTTERIASNSRSPVSVISIPENAAAAHGVASAMSPPALAPASRLPVTRATSDAPTTTPTTCTSAPASTIARTSESTDRLNAACKVARQIAQSGDVHPVDGTPSLYARCPLSRRPRP
jgi:hypothetical protein